MSSIGGISMGEAFSARLFIGALIVLIVLGVFYSSSLGNTDFFTRGEGREALVVSSMFEQENFILPRRNLALPSKPPAFHWLAVGFVRVLGEQSEFAIRLPSAVCAALSLAVFFVFVGQVVSLQAAVFSILILASSLQWIRAAGHARVDMVFAFWLTLSFVGVYRSIGDVCSQGWLRWFWPFVTGIAFCGAVLAKGPAGVMLPCLVGVLYFLLRRRAQAELGFRRSLASAIVILLICCGLSSVWYYLAYVEGGEEFLHRHFLEENINRFVTVDNHDSGHVKPFYFGVLYLLFAFLPWSLFVPVSLGEVWKKRKGLVGGRDSLFLFCLLWVLVFVLVVSISSSKRMVYFLPALPAFALLMGLIITQSKVEEEELAWLKGTGIFVWVLFGIYVAVVVGACCVWLWFGADALKPFRIRPYDEVVTAAVFQEIFSLSFLPALLIGAGVSLGACAWFLMSGSLSRAVVALAALSFISGFCSNYYVLPILGRFASPKQFMSEVNVIVPEGAKLYQYLHDYYAADFYGQHSAPLTDRFVPFSSPYVIVRADELEEVLAKLPENHMLLKSNTFAANQKDYLCLVGPK